jgi:hypothetical protein
MSLTLLIVLTAKQSEERQKNRKQKRNQKTSHLNIYNATNIGIKELNNVIHELGSEIATDIYNLDSMVINNPNFQNTKNLPPYN